MVNKYLNESLSTHIEKVNSGNNYIPKKPKIGFKEHWKLIKNYFCNTRNYENKEISQNGVTVVKCVEEGFRVHWNAFKRFILKLFGRK